MNILDACYERWSDSELAKANPRRRMAWLFSYRQKSLLTRTMIDVGGFQEPYAHSLLGCPIYVGRWNPDPLPLFLPEPTVRSMVGIWDRESEEGL